MLEQTLKQSQQWALDGEAVLCQFGDDHLRISQVLPGVLRFTLIRHPLRRGHTGPVEPESARPVADLPLAVSGSEAGPVTVTAGNIQVEVYEQESMVRIGDLTQLTLQCDAWRPQLGGILAPGEYIYGLGEPDQHSTVGLDRRGRTYEVLNLHQPSPSRLVLPVFYSSGGYGLFLDNSWAARVDMGETVPDRWTYRADGGNLDFYVLTGTLPAMVQQFTELTGRPALLPRWTLGYIQSKFGYKNRAELERVAATFRKKGIPCDGLVLDLYWFKHMGDLRFNRTAFPNAAEMISQLREQGFKLITIEEPYVVEPARLHAEGEAAGYFARFPDGHTVFPFWAHPEGASLVDFTNPEAAKWWGRQHASLVASGIAGWWLDLNEPEQHYAELLHQGGPAAGVHNTFALRMIKAVADAQAEQAPGSRCFIMSRSGWVGMAAHGATTWSGDVMTTFSDLSNQPALGMGMGLAGVPGWNSDVGGFKGEVPSPELYVRWVQFAAFTPIMRPHGEHQNREPWQFGKKAEAISIEYIRLRQRLVPYLYNALFEAYQTGAPVMRPLVWTYPDDPNVSAIADQYLYGPDFLVAPVLAEGARSRKVYLPEGEWYDFASRKPVAGGRWLTVQAPLAQLPLFVRAGAIIPLAPLTQYDQPTPPAMMTLTVWPGAAPSAFTLYEDDGATDAYKRGVCARTHVTASAGAGRMIIEPPVGPYAAELPARTWALEVVRANAPAAVREGGRTLTPCPSEEGLAQAASGWWYDEAGCTLHVKLAPSAGAHQVEISES